MSNTHGHTRAGKISSTYRTWYAMRQRCSNPKDDAYKNYGGRGIKVCRRWQTFEGFLTDVGERPPGRYKGRPKFTLDRIDNDGHYKPGNVRWANAFEQGRNRRSNVMITVKGKTRTQAEWARALKVPQSTLSYRMVYGGMTPEAAVRKSMVAA